MRLWRKGERGVVYACFVGLALDDLSKWLFHDLKALLLHSKLLARKTKYHAEAWGQMTTLTT